MLLVYGDTNSTMAGALAGAQAGVPVAHVEAGMRSYDRTMPEEINRVVADHTSSLLLCSSERSAEILRGERVAGEVVVVGDVMVDVAQLLEPRARERTQALEDLRRRAGRVPRSPPPTARGTWTTRRGLRGSSTCCSPCRGRSSCHCIRARARGGARPGCWSAWRRACGWRRRSAIWTSRRCCSTRGRR